MLKLFLLLLFLAGLSCNHKPNHPLTASSPYMDCLATTTDQDKWATAVIRDDQYCPDKAFFFDSNYYGAYYRSYFGLPDTNMPAITRVILFRLERSMTFSIYHANPEAFPDFHFMSQGFYKRLSSTDSFETSDYSCNPKEGYFILRNNLADIDDQLLAYFETSSGYKSSNDRRVYNSDLARYECAIVNGDTIYPFVLRPVNPDSSQPTWKLSWRNVYTLGEMPPFSAMCFKISQQDTTTLNSTDYVNLNGFNTFIADHFGISENGVPKIADSSIFDFNNAILIIPKNNGPEPFNNPNSILSKNPLIYKYQPDSFVRHGVKSIYSLTISIHRK